MDEDDGGVIRHSVGEYGRYSKHSAGLLMWYGLQAVIVLLVRDYFPDHWPVHWGRHEKVVLMVLAMSRTSR
jgi:hypothetical protein